MKSYLILLTHHEIPCFPVFFHLFPWDLSIFTHGQQDSQPEASLLDGRRALLAFARGKARGTMMPGRSGSGANFSGWICCENPWENGKTRVIFIFFWIFDGDFDGDLMVIGMEWRCIQWDLRA
jgi:hypothetical protein